MESGEIIESILLKKRICFVCTGNTCRSPMAAAAVNHLWGDRFIATSAGLLAGRAPIAPLAKKALEYYEIEPVRGELDYRRHNSRSLNESIIKENNMIYGLTAEHSLRIIAAYPLYAEKIFEMPRDINDPWGGFLDDYIKALGEILSCLREIIEGFSNGI